MVSSIWAQTSVLSTRQPINSTSGLSLFSFLAPIELSFTYTNSALCYEIYIFWMLNKIAVQRYSAVLVYILGVQTLWITRVWLRINSGIFLWTYWGHYILFW